MRRYAVSIAVIGFFVLGAVGCACDVPMSVCAMRAAVGAVALYILTMIAGKMILNVVVSAMVRNRGGAKENTRGHTG